MLSFVFRLARIVIGSCDPGFPLLFVVVLEFGVGLEVPKPVLPGGLPFAVPLLASS